MADDVAANAATALPAHDATTYERKRLRELIAEGEAALVRSRALLDKLAGQKPPWYP